LYNRATGLAAASLVALSPLHVEVSRLIRPDIQMTFFIGVVFWFCLDILEQQTWWSSVLAGLFAGVAAATKYPAVVALLIIVLAHLWSGSERKNRLAKLLVAGGAGIVGVFAASPFLVLQFGRVLKDVAFEARPTHLSATGQGLVLNLLWYSRGPLVQALSLVGVALAGMGILGAVVSRQKNQWLLVVFPVAFFIFIASLHLRWARWFVPVIPFLCLLAGNGLYRIAVWIGSQWDKRLGLAAGALLLLTVTVPLLRQDLVQGHELSGTDTRSVARAWILQHIPAHSSVLVEEYTPQIPVDRYRVYQVLGGQLQELDTRNASLANTLIPIGVVGELKDIKQIRRQGIEYIILSNWYDRYSAERERYPGIVGTYQSLMSTATELYETQRRPGVNNGPTIRVYRFELSN
jgi:hypothetical protein